MTTQPGLVQFESVPGRDSIGDVRTTFSQSQVHLSLTQLSVIALQGDMSMGNSQLRPWNTGLPGTMSLVDWAVLGRSSKAELIAEKQNENGNMVLGLRFLGFIIMWLGLQLVVGPIALMPQILPCCGHMLGELVGCALCCMTCLISLALSITVVGFAWLVARPLLGFGLLLLAAGAAFGAVCLRRRFRKARDTSISEPFAPSTVSNGPQVQVTCPVGVAPGQLLMIQCPDGTQRQVQVPPNVHPGMAFNVML